jgi:hypothetical protein
MSTLKPKDLTKGEASFYTRRQIDKSGEKNAFTALLISRPCPQDDLPTIWSSSLGRL